MLRHDVQCWLAFGVLDTPKPGQGQWVQTGQLDTMKAVKTLFPEALGVAAYNSSVPSWELIQDHNKASLPHWLAARPQLQVVLPAKQSALERLPCQTDIGSMRGMPEGIFADLLLKAPPSNSYPGATFQATAKVLTVLGSISGYGVDVDIALPHSRVKQLPGLQPVQTMSVRMTSLWPPVLMTQHHPPILVQCPMWPPGSGNAGEAVAMKEALLTVFSFDDSDQPEQSGQHTEPSAPSPTCASGGCNGNTTQATAAGTAAQASMQQQSGSAAAEQCLELPPVSWPEGDGLGPMIGLSGLSKLGLVLDPATEGWKMFSHHN